MNHIQWVKSPKIESVRLEGGDPPPKVVSLTAFSQFFFYPFPMEIRKWKCWFWFDLQTTKVIDFWKFSIWSWDLLLREEHSRKGKKGVEHSRDASKICSQAPQCCGSLHPSPSHLLPSYFKLLSLSQHPTKTINMLKYFFSPKPK